jgi:hypothetical protein
VALILCVHGIGQQLKGPEIVANEWRAAMRDGMRLAGAKSEELPGNEDIGVTFYGDLFREEAMKGGDPPFQFADIGEGFEADLVRSWLHVAEATSPPSREQGGHGEMKSGWQTEAVQKLAVALLHYRFFAALSERLFVGALKQVRQYFADAGLRRLVRHRLATQIDADTQLILAHSLGSIVAYEVISEVRDKTSLNLITLGSPLGLPNLIFHRLEPVPVNSKGAWPGDVRRWINISDDHDIVAAVKELAPFFAGVRDIRVANEALAHDVNPYLTSRQTGAAILEALRG